MIEPPTGAETHAERSLLRRLAQTPLRDVVRGRITGRLNVESILVEAALSEELARLVRSVVKKTRLWRIEKADVARELAAHMRDAAESGRGAAEIVRTFGDPKRAAKMIGRAKRRTRPLFWRIWAGAWKGVGALLVLLVAAYGVASVSYWTARPNPAHDYIADFNASARAVPEEQRAWPKYREALLGVDLPAESAWSLTDDPPGTSLPHAIADWLDRNQAAMEGFRAAAAIPRFGYVAFTGFHEEDFALWKHENSGFNPVAAPDADQPIMISLMMPCFRDLRIVSRLLDADAVLAARDGDSARCATDLAAMLGIAGHARDDAAVIGDLIGLSILLSAVDELGRILAEYPALLSDEQLRDLAHRMSGYAGGGRITAQLSAERTGLYDVLQRAYTDDGHGGGRLTPNGVHILRSLAGIAYGVSDDFPAALGPVAQMIVADRKSMREKWDGHFDAMEAEAALPLWEKGVVTSDQNVIELKQSTFDRARYYPISLLLPALGSVSIKTELATQQRDAVLVTIALHLYYRHHARWPDSLEELVPALLPSVPPDRFDGKPIRYKLVDGRPLLYSVGTDRKDGGGASPRMPFADAVSNVAASRWMPASQVEEARRAARRHIMRAGPVSGKIIPGDIEFSSAEVKEFSWSDFPEGDWVLWPPVVDLSPREWRRRGL